MKTFEEISLEERRIPYAIVKTIFKKAGPRHQYQLSILRAKECQASKQASNAPMATPSHFTQTNNPDKKKHAVEGHTFPL